MMQPCIGRYLQFTILMYSWRKNINIYARRLADDVYLGPIGILDNGGSALLCLSKAPYT